jgi:hypothetical protein
MKWTDQTIFYQKVMHQIADALSQPDSENYQGGWLYANQLNASPLEQYTNHFYRLVELANNPEQRPIIQARLRWVDADLHGRLINDMYLRDDGMFGDFAITATNILWHSRGRALRTMNIDNHISLKDLITASPLLAWTGTDQIRKWVKVEEQAGKVVLGTKTNDKRAKWVSLSVDSLRKQWTRRLTWYLVRMVMFYRNTAAEEGTKIFWTKDLNMPGEIFDWVTEHLDDLDFFNDLTLHNTKTYSKPYLRIIEDE